MTQVEGRHTMQRRMNDIRRSYWRVTLVWVLTLAALYALQEYFS